MVIVHRFLYVYQPDGTEPFPQMGRLVTWEPLHVVEGLKKGLVL
jgi:hypothetical protein